MWLENIGTAALTFTNPKLHRTENNRFALTKSLKYVQTLLKHTFFATQQSLVPDRGKLVSSSLQSLYSHSLKVWTWYRHGTRAELCTACPGASTIAPRLHSSQ